jgi:hypothetical protein
MCISNAFLRRYVAAANVKEVDKYLAVVGL